MLLIKALNIWKRIYRRFLMLFSLSIFIISVLISISGIEPSLIDSSTILYVGIIFGFISFFLWFRALNASSRIKRILNEVFIPLFLTSLLLIISSDLNLLSFKFLQSIHSLLTILAVFSGIGVLHLANKTNLEEEYIPEKLEEQKRQEDFKIKFSRINRLPIIGKIAGWIYKEGLIVGTSLVVIFVVGLFLRIQDISISLWIDESYSFESILNVLKHAIPVFDSGLVYTVSPIFHYLTSPLVYLWDNEISFRILSVIFGLVTPIIFFALLKKRYGKVLSTFVYAFLMLSPLFVIHTTFGRHYGLLFFATALYFYLTDKNRRGLALLVALLSVAVHLFGIILIISWIIGFLFKAIKNKKLNLKYFIPFAIIGVGVFYSVLKLTIPDIQSYGLSALLPTVNGIFENIVDYYKSINSEFLVLVVFMIIGLVLFIKKNYKKELVLITTTIFNLLIISFYIPNANIRYSIIIWPLLILFWFYAIFHLTRSNKKRLIISIVSLALIIGYQTLQFDNNYINPYFPFPDFKRAYSYIGEGLNPETIIVSATWGGAPGKIYLKEKFSLNSNYLYNNEPLSYELYSYNKDFKNGFFLKNDKEDDEFFRDKYTNQILLSSLEELQDIEAEEIYFVLDHNRLTTTDMETMRYLMETFDVLPSLSDNQITVFLKKDLVNNRYSILNLTKKINTNEPVYIDLANYKNTSIYIKGRNIDDRNLKLNCDNFKLKTAKDKKPGATRSYLINLGKNKFCKVFLSPDGNAVIHEMIVKSEN